MAEPKKVTTLRLVNPIQRGAFASETITAPKASMVEGPLGVSVTMAGKTFHVPWAAIAWWET